MGTKESYETRINGLEEKYKSPHSGQSRRQTKKKVAEKQAILDYIEKIYSQETKASETLSRKSYSLSDLEQKYSHY